MFDIPNSNCYLTSKQSQKERNMKKFNKSLLGKDFVQASVIGILEHIKLNNATLQTWANRGLILDDQDEVGTGKLRKYSMPDICQIMTMRVLTWQGVKLTAAVKLGRRVAERCKERVFGLCESTDDLQIIYFNDNGKFKYIAYLGEAGKEYLKIPIPLMYGVVQADKIVDEVYKLILDYPNRPQPL